MSKGMRLLASIIKNSVIFVVLTSCCYANDIPLLIDVNITGLQAQPDFEPKKISLVIGQEYVMVINNDTAQSMIFNHQKLGQQVFTHQLQGTPSVTQDQVNLMPNSKVQWHFTPQQAGKFKFYAAVSGLVYQGPVGEIVIQAPADNSVNVSTIEQSNKSPVSHAQTEENATKSSITKPIVEGETEIHTLHRLKSQDTR